LKEGLVTDETSNTCEYDLHLEVVIVVKWDWCEVPWLWV
jgi:hypothetical protein